MNIIASQSLVDVPGACDCHVHVIGPYSHYSLVPVRSYTPVQATVDDLISMMHRARLERAVIVQPSVLGQDNRCTLDALPRLRQAGLDGRAVAVLDDPVSGTELDRLHDAGVRGLRVNLHSHVSGDMEQAQLAIRQASLMCTRNGWHLQLFTDRQTILVLQSVLQNLPVPLVFDHFAGLSPDLMEDEATTFIYELLQSGQAWIKLSGTYRVGDHAFDDRLVELSRRLAQINPDHLVWASDWPHTPKHQGKATTNPPVAPYRDIETSRLRGWVHDWFEPALASQVLSANPARLYGFEDVLS